MEKVQVQSITVDPVETIGNEFTVDSFKEANAALGQLSQFAPKGGAYHKCDFTITFEDGYTYSGRYDLKHWTEELPSLNRHVKNFVEVSAGLVKPLWMETHPRGEEFWADLCERGQKDGSAKEYKDFAATYDVGVAIQ